MEKHSLGETDLRAENLNGIARLDAQLAFLSKEKSELEHTLDVERREANVQIKDLKEQLEDMCDQV